MFEQLCAIAEDDKQKGPGIPQRDHTMFPDSVAVFLEVGGVGFRQILRGDSLKAVSYEVEPSKRPEINPPR